MRRFGLPGIVATALSVYVALLVPAASTPAASREQIVATFEGGGDGKDPNAGLITDASGSLYGTTEYGGGSVACGGSNGGCGTVFKLTPSDHGFTKTILYRFQGGLDGANPDGLLAIDASGVLYGTAQTGGVDFGTAFRLTPAGSGYAFDVIYTFQFGGDSAWPQGLIIGPSGTLYGTAEIGGPHGCGTVYMLTPPPMPGANYRESILYSFRGPCGVSIAPQSRMQDGAYPRGGLATDLAGALYGTTYIGGGRCHLNLDDGCGSAFEISPTAPKHRESVVFRFRKSGRDGAFPHGGILLGDSGVLYGATPSAGMWQNRQQDLGAAFSLSPSSKESGYSIRTLYRFRGGPDGNDPNGALISNERGDLLGTTLLGGTCATSGGCGTVYELERKPNGEFRKRTLYRFRGGADGYYPNAGLTPIGGVLYGTTFFGGGGGTGCSSQGCGTVFALRP
jgi:uncharacterized repeat protein (TIGR03803 family)